MRMSSMPRAILETAAKVLARHRIKGRLGEFTALARDGDHAYTAISSLG